MIDKNILVESLNDSEKQVWFCDFQLSRRVGRCVIDLSPLNAARWHGNHEYARGL